MITDLHTFYLPSLTLPPLDVDINKKGVASDHSILIFAPAQNSKLVIKRQKKTIKIRPIPFQSMMDCGKYIGTYSWEDIKKCENADEKAKLFHDFLKSTLDRFFSTKRGQNIPI